MGERGSEAFRKSLKTLEGRAWFNRVWNAVKDAFKAVMCAASGAAELAPQSPAPEATWKETHARSAIDETLAPT